MSNDSFSRRGFLAGLGSLGAATLLGGCATSATGGGGAQTSGAVTIESNLSAPAAKAAMQALVDAFNARKGAQATLNTIASETYRTQLPSYLTSQQPSDLYTWYVGSVARSYADKGLLLDISDVWQNVQGYNNAAKTLSTAGDGKQVIVPISYYWWGMFYRKSKFAEWGVQPPTDWNSFIALCETLKSKGVAPIGMGAGGTTPWVASAWFDYLNIRINGAPYHRELLAGKRKFTDPQVKAVFDRWKTVLPYFDPQGTAIPFQDATTSLLQGRTAMMLIGTFFADSAPKDQLADIDFFQFPIIDPAVPVAEEGPMDGFFASARSSHVAQTKEFLSYVATAEAQELYAKASTSTVLPVNTGAKANSSPLVDKGKKLLDSAAEITQFFNRDSSDALQPTADTALIKFFNQPNNVDGILSEWQSAAEKVWAS
ncbi:ABC transporter substrate-binding protein [Kibdelosporangium philippinense]|uniref:ABC transporter substrate-binding protein n=1 Tax=Kibdelosporangium philippinense TaxID=211113 RepID=A0ABS8ZU76_9PSEU|nr:ABC transporter substrate-binding protein [Kibdelosporangium philippinense]MCE7011139.1 ABC transporter substrate-binding protein [Kibdelosporangium philippinense]